jgi:hypothetical protein
LAEREEVEGVVDFSCSSALRERRLGLVCDGSVGDDACVGDCGWAAERERERERD